MTDAGLCQCGCGKEASAVVCARCARWVEWLQDYRRLRPNIEPPPPVAKQWVDPAALGFVSTKQMLQVVYPGPWHCDSVVFGLRLAVAHVLDTCAEDATKHDCATAIETAARMVEAARTRGQQHGEAGGAGGAGS